MHRSFLMALALSFGVALLALAAGIPEWTDQCPVGEPCAAAPDSSLR